MKQVKLILIGLLVLTLTACQATTPDTAQEDALKQQVNDLTQAYKDLEATKGTLEQSLKDSQDNLATTKETLKQLENDYIALQEKYDAIKGDVKTTGSIVTPSGAKALLEERAINVLYAIRDNNFEKLATYVHPAKGVRFTPITTIDVDNDVVFNQAEVANIFDDPNMYVWGSYDGTGEAIRLSAFQYYEKYVNDADYLNAPNVGYNEIVGVNNNIENSAEVYPTSVKVEYHFNGFDEKYQGMDWVSLRLVFEEHKDGKWYLVGIIHNGWTI